MCLPLSLLLLLPVAGLLLLAAVLGLTAHGPLGVAAAALLLWTLWRACVRVVLGTRGWWAWAGRPLAGPPERLEVTLTGTDLP